MNILYSYTVYGFPKHSLEFNKERKEFNVMLALPFNEDIYAAKFDPDQFIARACITLQHPEV